MTRNRNLAMKLADQQRRSVNLQSTDTRRVNRFVDRMAPTFLDPQDFVSREALARNTVKFRALMTVWAEFARTLERDLNLSVPEEWLKEPPHRRPQE